MTLLIMAAGMGSRFGGLKQIEPVGPSGEFILDYSIYDAIKAGFNEVVFIIKKENYELFRDTVGKRIEDKIKRFSCREDQYPVNNWLNDIFGVRIILTSKEIELIMELLDDWQEELELKNWYLRNKEGYKGLHIYFKNKNNFYFPWELQIWDEKDVKSNIENHEKFKRNFI